VTSRAGRSADASPGADLGAAAAPGAAKPGSAGRAAREPGGRRGAQAPGGRRAGRQAAPAHRSADRALTALYGEHYAALVRPAAFLVQDMATAEKVVQDSFVALHAAWRRLPDADDALSFLRQSVVNRSRSVLRDRPNRNPPGPPPEAAGAERRTITGLEHPALISALRALPARQREVLVLRYYANLSETQIAQAMGISRSAVKRHCARAAAALAAPLDSERE